MDELKQCNRCGEIPIDRHGNAHDITKPRKLIYWYECPKCGLRSDSANNRKQAAYEWNYKQREKWDFERQYYDNVQEADDMTKKKDGAAAARAALAAKKAAMTPEELAAYNAQITAKARESKARKQAEKEAAMMEKTEIFEDMTPRDVVDALREDGEHARDATILPVTTEQEQEITLDLNIEESELASSHEIAPPIDAGTEEFYQKLKSAKSDGDYKITPRYPSAKEAARSSVEAAVEVANPDDVQKIRAALGEFYGIESVAAALQVTTRSVLTYLRSGKLEGVKIGGQWRISIEALKRFMGAE